MVSKNKSRAGFTLVEILAVLVIIGIASAIVIPQLGTRDDLRAAAAARIIVADLIYAQNVAISTQKTVYARFDTANNRYKLLSAVSPDTLMSHPMTQVAYQQNFGTGTSGLETVALSDVVFSGVDANYANLKTIAFDEMGAPYAYSDTLSNKSDLKIGSIGLTSGTFTTIITIAPYTGEISVQ
jgi:prepilin-type N-terminal cleavage/methylation domain-containing protein